MNAMSMENKDELITELRDIIARQEYEIIQLKGEREVLQGKLDQDREIATLSNAFLSAKGNQHAAIHALFNLIHSGKIQDVKNWAKTGSIHTRGGLLHWKFDARLLRNEKGATVLHEVVTERGKEKIKLEAVQFFYQELEFNPNTVDMV